MRKLWRGNGFHFGRRIPLQEIPQLLWANRLREVLVHPRCLAALLIAFHGMRGQGDDCLVASVVSSFLFFSDG